MSNQKLITRLPATIIELIQLMEELLAEARNESPSQEREVKIDSLQELLGKARKLLHEKNEMASQCINEALQKLGRLN